MESSASARPLLIRIAALLTFVAVAVVAIGCGLGTSDSAVSGEDGLPTESPPANPPEDALRRWVQNRLFTEFIDDCDDAKRPDDVGKHCARQRGERNGLLAFEVGPTFGDYTNLFILRQVGDRWTVVHHEKLDPNAPVPEGIPWPIEIGADLVISGTGDCLRIRDRPGTAADDITCLEDGTVVTVEAGPVVIDDIEWWRLEGYGWAASNWLRYPEEASADAQGDG